MPRTIKPAKPNLKQLTVLKRMVEENLGVIASRTLDSSYLNLFYRDMSGFPEKSYDWINNLIDGRTNLIGDFYNWGWINRAEMPPWDDEKKRSGIFSWSDNPYVLTRNAREYWATTGEAEFNRLTKIEAEKRAKVERLVAIRATNHYYKPGGRIAGMLVRVIRETENRLYVEIVGKAVGDPDFYYVSGNRDKVYIDRNQVTIDGITEEKYAELVEVENSIQAERRALQDEETRAIQEIRDRFKDRRIQTQAEFDSRIRGVTG